MIQRRGLLRALGLAPFGKKKGPDVQALYQFQRKIVLPTGATTGARIVIDSTQNAIFIYDASNNLVESIAAGSGTDATSGQKYIAGDTVYDRVNNIFANLQAGLVSFGQISGGNMDVADEAKILFKNQSGQFLFQILSVLNTGAGLNDAARIELFPGAAPSTNPLISLSDNLGTVPAITGIAGYAVQQDFASGALETWQAPIAAANFTVTTLQYRLDAEDNVHWVGEISQTTGQAGPGGATCITAVPTKYRPRVNYASPGSWISSSSVAKGSVVFRVNTDGTVLLLWPSATANGDRFSFNVKIPLGNIT